MRRAIQILNLLGVLALAALCCSQWTTNRQLNLQAATLERVRLDQLARLNEQDRTIAGQIADLEDFRQRLILSESALKDAHAKFLMIEAERNKLVAECNELKAALEKWTAAVQERDASLKSASEQIQKLIAERDDAIAKCNELANRYNALVKQMADQKK